MIVKIAISAISAPCRKSAPYCCVITALHWAVLSGNIIVHNVFAGNSANEGATVVLCDKEMLECDCMYLMKITTQAWVVDTNVCHNYMHKRSKTFLRQKINLQFVCSVMSPYLAEQVVFSWKNSFITTIFKCGNMINFSSILLYSDLWSTTQSTQLIT